MTEKSDIVLVGVDHAGAPLDTVERLHGLLLDAGRVPALRRGESEVRLATCHRLESYMEGVSVSRAREAFCRWIGARPESDPALTDAPVVRRGADAARHLLRVASGLESAVLGEDQVLQQVRAAYREACAAGTAGPRLHRLFHAAFRAGKRVRTETSLASGSRSLAGAAVAALNGILGGVRDRTVLVLGAGEMGSLAARRLRKRKVGRLLLCNRTGSKAAALAGEMGAECVRWEWRRGALRQADAVICATGATVPVVPARWLLAAESEREAPLVIVDLAVPRNVERPATRTRNLSLIDVEDLSRQLEEEKGRRRRAVRSAEAIVEEELESWLDWVETREERTPPRCRSRRADRAAG